MIIWLSDHYAREDLKTARKLYGDLKEGRRTGLFSSQISRQAVAGRTGAEVGCSRSPIRPEHKTQERNFMKRLIIMALVLLMAGTAWGQNTTIQSFGKAKKTLLRQVYTDHKVTFYCGCKYEGKQVSPCDNYAPKKASKRSKRIEWEHIVPAAHFGQSFKEWREGDPACVNKKGKSFKGRKCAEKMNKAYRFMQSDMYNLVPAIGEINGLRSNYRFGVIAGESREFGACDMEIAGKIAEPPERIRGDIARTYKYMNQAYPKQGIISKANKKLFNAWDKGDPVDAWECERCRRIEAIQGNENPILKKACKKAGL